MQQWRSHEGGTCPHNPNPARPWDSPRSEENFFVWGYGVLPDGPLTPVGPTQPKMWVITLERIGLQFVLSVRRSFIYDNWWSAAQFYLHVWITFLMSVPSECIILTNPTVSVWLSFYETDITIYVNLQAFPAATALSQNSTNFPYLLQLLTQF